MSLDKLFENRIRSMLGDEYDDFEKALEKEPVKAIRINPLKQAILHVKDDEFSSEGKSELVDDLKIMLQKSLIIQVQSF